MGSNSLAEKNLFAQGQMQTFIVPENLYKLQAYLLLKKSRKDGFSLENLM